MSQIEEQRLITKIASLYYEEGLKQSEISAQLDLSQSFISRALRRALQDGVVKISVMRLQGLHLELENQLQRRYDVRQVIVVEATEPGNDESIKQAIGSAAAHYLETSLSPQDHIGISSWSSTIRAMVGHLHAQPGKQAAQEEHHRDRDQVHDRDPLVVLGQQPRRQAVTVVQVVPLGNLELVQHGLLRLSRGGGWLRRGGGGNRQDRAGVAGDAEGDQRLRQRQEKY